MPEFDPHAAIKELVEVELLCPSPAILESPYLPKHDIRCRCGGTGCIVPFASLRIACPNIANQGEATKWHLTCMCGGKLWIPEPDIRAACWAIIQWLTDEGLIIHKHFGEYAAVPDLDYPPKDMRFYPSLREAVFRTAISWVKEQYKPS